MKWLKRLFGIKEPAPIEEEEDSYPKLNDMIFIMDVSIKLKQPILPPELTNNQLIEVPVVSPEAVEFLIWIHKEYPETVNQYRTDAESGRKEFEDLYQQYKLFK